MSNPPQGPVQPHKAIRAAEPGTPEHDAWRAEQETKQRAYEAKFAEWSEYRPKHWR